MKKSILTKINSLIAMLLCMLGVCSCKTTSSPDPDILPAPEYGVPYAEFELTGSVKNEDDEALQNIQIVRRGGWKDGAGNKYWEQWADTLYTNADGDFYRLYRGDFPLEFCMVIANDTAGVYASDSTETTVTYSGGDGYWNSGKGDLKADFVLKKKEQ